MLEARPGAFIFIGNGDSASLHNPAYDFNDDAIAYGISYWVQLAENALRPSIDDCHRQYSEFRASSDLASAVKTSMSGRMVP